MSGPTPATAICLECGEWRYDCTCDSYDWIQALSDLLRDSGAVVTFSIWCSSGYGFCGCWRCRMSRDKHWDEDTESAARDHSEARQRGLFLKSKAKMG